MSLSNPEPNDICVLVEDLSLSKVPFVKALDQILNLLNLKGVSVSLLLCTDERIHELNKTYRGKDKPTDVLSFAQREGEFADPNDPLLGDVVISVDTAIRQASEYNHKLSAELELLLVHGVLHLLGYDHMEDEEAEEMEAKERALCGQLSVDWSLLD